MGLSHHYRDKGGMKALHPSMSTWEPCFLTGWLCSPCVEQKLLQQLQSLGLAVALWYRKTRKLSIGLFEMSLTCKGDHSSEWCIKAKRQSEGSDINWHSFSSQAKDGFKLSSKCHLCFSSFLPRHPEPLSRACALEDDSRSLFSALLSSPPW